MCSRCICVTRQQEKTGTTRQFSRRHKSHVLSVNTMSTIFIQLLARLNTLSSCREKGVSLTRHLKRLPARLWSTWESSLRKSVYYSGHPGWSRHHLIPWCTGHLDHRRYRLHRGTHQNWNDNVERAPRISKIRHWPTFKYSVNIRLLAPKPQSVTETVMTEIWKHFGCKNQKALLCSSRWGVKPWWDIAYRYLCPSSWAPVDQEWKPVSSIMETPCAPRHTPPT